MALKQPCCSSFGRNSTSQGNVSSNCPVHRKNSPSLHLLLAYAHLGGSRALQSIPAVDRTSAANPCSDLACPLKAVTWKRCHELPFPVRKTALEERNLEEGIVLPLWGGSSSFDWHRKGASWEFWKLNQKISLLGISGNYCHVFCWEVCMFLVVVGEGWPLGLRNL